MTVNDFVSTGEAAKLLGISRSTVSRKFDQGLLRGKTNPITGERMVSRKSLAELLRRHSIPADRVGAEKKTVLISSADQALSEHFCGLLSKDERIALQSSHFGCDALVSVSKEICDLLVIDDEVPDISCAELIRSLRRAPGAQALRILCCARPETMGEALQWGADHVLSRDSLDTADTREVVYGLLGIAREQPGKPTAFEYERRWPRIEVELPARLQVYCLRAPRRRDPGTAMVRDISCGGALLSDITIDSGSIPAEPFRIVLEIDHAPLSKWRAHCQVVRLQAANSLSAALQFVRLSKPNLQQIKDLMEAEA